MTNPLVKKGLPQFPKGEEGKKEEIKEGTDVETNVGTNTNIEQFYVPVEKIEKKQVSIYLDTDVIEAFNKFGKDHGKGAKSDIVNNFLKQVFNIRQGDQNND
ncbi:hypothetical protein PDJ86_22420 [Bacillus cereus group sp. TH36-2LC]|uniref:hypothetical protein n=1 Tax=Bacillus cereus group sp. TH36-2LC TaxID=3018040 RepID=UPI0022E11552|nr:hypothetical protein [Bacillus cereus group sp. TH36-2LC]MDA1509615.1 hypothetical protein [Bacillus cereus group sp. TH36-2LC]